MAAEGTDRFYENYEAILAYILEGKLLKTRDAVLGICDLFYNYRNTKDLRELREKEEAFEVLCFKEADWTVRRDCLELIPDEASEIAAVLIDRHLR